MKKSIIICIGLFAAVAALAQEKFSEQFTIPLSKPGTAARIELDHLNGDITVTGYSGSEVIITASASGSSLQHGCDDCHEDKKSAPPGMKRVNANPMELRAKESNNVVSIESDSWKRRMNIEVKAPINADLDLNTVHGTITVKGINGTMEISGVNGGIALENISGSVVANTVNGDVKVTFKSLTSGEPMSFVTLNGDVDVTLPANAKATTKLRSERGEIYTDFDMALERSKTNVKKESGEYEVSINSWVYGKINGGGPEFTFKNMHGSIIVRKGN
ncbi:DUF4097 family beta strand repeat-containing protein [Marinoscillum sp.]|uniref:DUF4097 family beta strand repeat-containing protein n=1 Tax=Marinoscillum sp. TaxID=2024838 RepID=UPI003BA90996